MPDRHYPRRLRRSLIVIFTVALLAATAVAADSRGMAGHGSLETAARLAMETPGVPTAGDVVPITAGGTLTRFFSTLPGDLQGEGSAPDTDAGGPEIASVSPGIASAGTNTTITIAGTGFGTKASRESPADVGFTSAGGVYWASGRTDPVANVDDIVSWSDTEVRVHVPTGFTGDGDVDSASSGTVRLVTDTNRTSNAVPVAVSFGVTKTKWTAGPVFVVNDNCPGIAGGAGAVRRAVATWNTALPPAFRINCSGITTSTAIDDDGVSIIAWGSPAGTTIWYDTNRTIVEADIILDAETAWTTGTAGGATYSIEALALQNLGYGLGIALLAGVEPQGPSDAGKVCSRWRGDELGNMNLVALSPADRAAATYLYEGGSATPPLLAAAFTADRVAGAAPLAVQFGDASFGGATGRAWDFGDNKTSTERDPAHTYSAPGTYTIVLTASAPGYPDDTIRAIRRIAVAGATVLAVPGGTGAPTDTNTDGRYDDVNGNGRSDFADVVLYFNTMTWITANEPVTAFDFNGNGRIDFADVVWLFNNL